MQSSRDSSLWRSLAVAFGDGLAFGVGVKLTQAAGRQLSAPAAPAAAPPRADAGPLADRIDQIEQNLKRIERVDRVAVAGSGAAVDQKVLEAIINALEARLAEYAGQVERRLADLDAKLAIELRSLDQQDHTMARQIAEDIAALQQQMLGVHREFGEAVARIVAEQVASQVEARAGALEQSIPARIAIAVEAAAGPRLASVRREVHDSLGGMVAERVASETQAHKAVIEEALRRQIPAEVEAAVESAVQKAVAAALPLAIEGALSAALGARLDPLEQQLRAALEQKDREIAELRLRLADTDTNVLELILGIGQICRQAAQRIPPAVAPVEEASGGGGEVGRQVEEGSGPVEDNVGAPSPDVPETGAGLDSLDDSPLPGFAQSQKPNRLWRVPLVSSLVLATGGLVALRHFLY